MNDLFRNRIQLQFLKFRILPSILFKHIWKLFNINIKINESTNYFLFHTTVLPSRIFRPNTGTILIYLLFAGSGTNNFGSKKKVWIQPDPDSQHWYIVWYLKRPARLLGCCPQLGDGGGQVGGEGTVHVRLQCVQVDLDDLSREKIVTFTVVRTGRYRYSKGNQGCGKTLHKVIFYKVFKAKMNANPQANVKTQKKIKKKP